MKIILFGTILVLLSACTNSYQPTEKLNDIPNKIDLKNTDSTLIDPKNISQLGETCGPESKKLCASGLSCQFKETTQTEGLCLPLVVNPDLECEENQKPVCGLIGNNKNGYLNECFAQRYGAIVLSEGFCKNDETIKNNCEAQTYSLGNCQTTFAGAHYNTETNNCETIKLVGCSTDIPFETLEACQSRCES